MKSKSFILMQIKNCLTDKFEYSDDEVEKYLNEINDKKVCELLTIKKDLENKEPEIDLSVLKRLKN